MSRMVVCPTCEGEGVIEGMMPVHHLHSECPEYEMIDCPECDGVCEIEDYDEDDVDQELVA